VAVFPALSPHQLAKIPFRLHFPECHAPGPPKRPHFTWQLEKRMPFIKSQLSVSPCNGDRVKYFSKLFLSQRNRRCEVEKKGGRARGFEGVTQWGSVGVLRSTFACMHFAHFPLFAPPFDGQKSTRSRVHFKLNLFAGASGANWASVRGVGNGGYEQLYYIAGVIHYFDSLTSIHLVVLVACHFVCFHFQPPEFSALVFPFPVFPIQF